MARPRPNISTVSALLLPQQALTILAACPPVFEDVYASQFTWAYGRLTNAFSFPLTEVTLTLNEEVVSPSLGLQCLLGTAEWSDHNGRHSARLQAEGNRPLGVTVSCRPGTRPGIPDVLTDGELRRIEPITLGLHLQWRRPEVLHPRAHAA